MDDKNRNKLEHVKTDVWGQHLHWIDLMNTQVDENTARYLARFREDTRRGKELLKEKLQVQQNAEPSRVPFWIIEK